jgi:hypothetical protein
MSSAGFMERPTPMAEGAGDLSPAGEINASLCRRELTGGLLGSSRKHTRFGGRAAASGSGRLNFSQRLIE